MVVVWFFGFLLEPSKNWLMHLELWIFTKMILPKLRVLFSATVRCGVYLKSTCNSRPTVLDFGQKIKSNNKNYINNLSFLVVNEVGIFFNHPTSAYSMFHPMVRISPQWFGCTSRLWNHWMPGSLCAVFFFEPNIDMPVALPRGFGGQCFRQKKKELWYFYSSAVNEQALLKYWKKRAPSQGYHYFLYKNHGDLPFFLIMRWFLPFIRV